MATKIILSDIDGTFLCDDKTVPELHANAVREILARGMEFAMVSARMPEAIYPITDGIGLPRIPVISYSGALVLTEAEQVLHDKKMPADDTAKILAEMNRWRDIAVNFYTGRNWYVREIDWRVQREIDITQATAEIADFDALLRAGTLPNKILVMCEPPVCEEMERELGKLFPRLNVVRSAPHLLEVMDRSVSKAVGIEILLKHYGFTVDEAIAFGDNYNDIEMLEYIPQSVAMGNAPARIKEIARAVTDSNEDAGIYTYLKGAGVLA